MATLVSALALEAPAAAQDSVAAAALFNRGLADMDAGRYDTGCPAIAESRRLDLRPGTVFTLADCEARWGRIASAVAHYDDYLSLFAQMTPAQRATQGERPKIARAQKTALMPAIPELALDLPPDAPSGTVVQRDGTMLTRASLGISLPLDPVEHVITTQAPGGPVTEIRVTLGKGDKKRITLGVKLPEAAAPGPPAADRRQNSPSPPAAARFSPGVPTNAVVRRRSKPLSIVGYVLTPVGGVLAVASAVLLIDNICTDPMLRCPQNDQNILAFGMLIAGGVVLGGGITAMVIGLQPVPSKPSKAASWIPDVGIGLTSGALRWTF